MKFVILLLVYFTVSLAADVARTRNSRSISDLCTVIECKTGRACGHYNLYGCYCGSAMFDGEYYGLYRPIDSIDRYVMG